MRYFIGLVCVLALGVMGCSETAGTGGDGGSGGVSSSPCELSTADALRECVKTLNDAARACFVTTDSACVLGNSDIATALDALEGTIRDECTGSSGSLSVDALVLRLRIACELETASSASDSRIRARARRTFSSSSGPRCSPTTPFCPR